MSNGTEIRPPEQLDLWPCQMCGAPLSPSGKRGRPRTFCKDACKRAWYAWGFLQGYLSETKMTPSKERLWRAEFWRLGNLITVEGQSAPK